MCETFGGNPLYKLQISDGADGKFWIIDTIVGTSSLSLRDSILEKRSPHSFVKDWSNTYNLQKLMVFGSDSKLLSCQWSTLMGWVRAIFVAILQDQTWTAFGVSRIESTIGTSWRQKGCWGPSFEQEKT
jgi:hypothetical protein